MDYEMFYERYLQQEKDLKDALKSLQKMQRAVARELEQGDVKKASGDLETLRQTGDALTSLLGTIQETVADFDVDTYFSDGTFVQQMLDDCASDGVDAIGSFPVFEMFPYKVTIDAENHDVFMNRKKLACMRPSYLVQMIKREQEKLFKASFNADRFAGELATAYDLAVAKQGKQVDGDIYLQTLYKLLVPMGRFRREYDQQNYAFDVARLYLSESTSIKDGRKFQFGPSRNNKKALRILDAEGREQYLATIRFYR